MKKNSPARELLSCITSTFLLLLGYLLLFIIINKLLIIIEGTSPAPRSSPALSAPSRKEN